ncbi:MAG: methyltransferase [Flavobacterium sp.]|nr:methyltransferase [Flavobacterium sp.]
MKVGTDGVLLGAWTPLDLMPESILDIGAGTGLIALQLAQRSSAFQIDALEIDEHAYEQAVDNFEQSPWRDRLFCYHAALDELVEEAKAEQEEVGESNCYDLIVCNPPFYSEDFKTNDVARDLARFQDALPFEELVEAADLLLSDEGILAVIIPFKEEERFIALCAQNQLFPYKITRVKGNPTTAIVRSLLAFSRNTLAKIPTNELVIEKDRHQYTPEYSALTRDFYLKMD